MWQIDNVHEIELRTAPSVLAEPPCRYSEASLEPLVFAEPFSCTPHSKSTAIPFDSLPRLVRIDQVMGLNEFLAIYQSSIAACFKKHSLCKLVNSQVLAFLLGFKLRLLLQQAKVDAFQVSVPCQMNRFPQKHPQRHQQF